MGREGFLSAGRPQRHHCFFKEILIRQAPKNIETLEHRNIGALEYPLIAYQTIVLYTINVFALYICTRLKLPLPLTAKIST